ncbi:hypothetical protein B9Z55_019370 [Caenorhabditis nigoni]|nr:hypothetical protein B9Z55_019370 [Caenorhabditis nigoni]
MLKFVKKKTTSATSPPPAPPIEISRPSNLIVSKHKLVRTEGDFILVVEDDKVVGILDKRDLELAVVPTVHSPPRPVSTTLSSTSSVSSPQSPPYLVPTSSNRSASVVVAATATGISLPQLQVLYQNSNKNVFSEVGVPTLSSPVGISPSKYKTLPAGFSAKQQSPLFQWQFSQGSFGLDSSSTSSNYKSTSVEQLFSPPIPTRNRSESTLQPQGSQKYDTITFAPAVQLPSNSASAQCNVEIHLGDDRSLPPPPSRAPPVPLSYSPCLCAVVHPDEQLDFTEVQSVSVEDLEIAAMSYEEVRKTAEDIESYIQGQIQEKWCQDRAQTEKWIEKIAGRVAKTETINTIKVEMSSRKRPSLSQVFDKSKSSCSSIAPSDPEPHNDYERLFFSREKLPTERQNSTESEGGDIEDIRF